MKIFKRKNHLKEFLIIPSFNNYYNCLCSPKNKTLSIIELFKKSFSNDSNISQFLYKPNYISSEVNLNRKPIIKNSIKSFSRNSTQWLNRHTNDFYVKKSVEMNYKSRAAFKLLEIQNKYKILKKGQKVFDIGSAPGGWSQIISELVHSNKARPDVIAVDILNMEPIEGVSFIQGDLTRKEIQEKILEKNNFEKFDVVLSDMCPEFVGQKYKDHYNLIKLNELTIDYSSKILKSNGILVMKTFEGTMQKKLQENIELYFEKIQRFKPASSRSESSELYLICLGFMKNEKLLKEIDKLEKVSINEFIEEKKNNTLKNYKIKKFDVEYDPQKLEKLREDIITIFKIDPEEIKISKEEENEIKQIIDKEKKDFHDEYFGAGYFHKPKSFSELIELFLKDQRENLEKLKDMTLSEKMDENAAQSYLQADAEVKHLEELAKIQMKDIEFMDRIRERVDMDIEDIANEERTRPDSKANKLLKKFQKWEQFLLEEIEKKEELLSDSYLQQRNNIQQNLQKQEDSFIDGVHKELKNRDKNKFNKSLNREAVTQDFKKQETDFFFQKSKKK